MAPWATPRCGRGEIITGIFLFLLGTKLGQAATRTEVKYAGPEKITVTEEKDDNIVLPGLGSPPFAPNFFHQGSNFYFNPQFVIPGGMTPTIESVIPVQPLREYSNITIVTPEMTSDIVIEKEPIVEMIVPEIPSIGIPQFEIEETIPQVNFDIESLPIGVSERSMLPALKLQPPFQVLVEDPYNITVPCEDIEINNIVPGVPILIEKHYQPSGEPQFISEVNVHVNPIPPPPELPPLIISDIPKPVVVNEDKRVILVPSAPELTEFYPPSVVVPEKPLNLMDCAQNIILERFLPNIAFENGRMVELISIPATKRAPVVSSIIY